MGPKKDRINPFYINSYGENSFGNTVNIALEGVGWGIRINIPFCYFFYWF
jgi:hypothetical protein